MSNNHNTPQVEALSTEALASFFDSHIIVVEFLNEKKKTPPSQSYSETDGKRNRSPSCLVASPSCGKDALYQLFKGF